MKKLLVMVATTMAMLTAARAQAQTVLPRAGWVANASSSNGGDVPSHVLDGSSSTRWTTGGDQTPGQWFTVDFGTAQTFTQVTMDVGSNTGDYARSYELYVSNDGQTWGSPVASGTGATGIITIVFPAQTARFIGIVQTGSSTTNWWSIVELNVYSGTVPTAPLTPNGWTATASASGSSDQPSNAIDGNLSTRFSTDAAQASGQTFQLDMGSAQLIAALKMDSGSSSTDYARGYQIFASNSTSNWGSAVATGTATSSPILVYFPQTTARYVKIALTAGASNWWSIAELTMYTVASSAPTAAVLARTGWTATASASASGNGPSNALDDNASTRWSTGANQTNGQSYVLDMQAPRSFTKLTLDTGSSSTGDYPRGYQVFVSGDGSTWGSAVATGSGSGQVTTISFPVQVGRYVKIVQTGSSSTNWWSIAELNVYGTPPATLLRDNWTASASLDNSEAQLGIDGRVETQWSTNTAQGAGMSYQVDMKIVQTFNEITLDVECNPADYPRGVQVFVSNDGTSWGSAIASATGTAAIVTVAFPQQSARYLKVVSTASASNYWGLAELNVLNTNPSACSSPCVALDQCHDVGTCDPSTGVCSNPLKSNGTSCNDGNLCTQTDTCQAGVCTGGNPVTCAASDQCHGAGACNSSTGTCSNPTVADGTACNDGKSCTTGDVCTAGVCGGTIACSASDQCHGAGACDANGACTNPVVADGTSCSDGNACTQTDSCQAGVCTGSNPVACAASDQCHVAGACDPATGLCSNPVAANGTACNDGNACTQIDTCQGGACTGGSPVTCAASDQCHVAGVCDPASGACSNPTAVNGTACSDGNACTQTDSCQAGVCTGANPVTCVASDQCHVAGVCDPTSGQCSNPLAANGTSCNDNDACTQTDSCQSGVCTGGNPVTCAASDQCHTAGTCDPASGTCSNPMAANGTACNDGNSCTTGDVCTSGVCAGSGSCGSAQVTASLEFGSSSQQPDLPFSVTLDRPGVHPGETVNVICQLGYDGVAVSTDSRLDIANQGSSDFVVPGYSVTVEYESTVSHDWVPVAELAFDASGQPLPPAAPYELTFSAALAYQYNYLTDTVDPIVTPGVTYAPGRMAGTSITPGSTAISQLTSNAVLPKEILPVLTDPAQAMALRETLRIDAAPGLPNGAELSIPIDPLPSRPLDVEDLEGLAFWAGTINYVNLNVPDSVAIGSTATFSTPFLVPPPLTPSAAASQQGGYKGYLQRLAQSGFQVQASIQGGSPGFSSGANVSANSAAIPMLVPIVNPTMVSGSPSPQPAGYPLSYNLSLQNIGTDPALNVALQDWAEVDSISITDVTLQQANIVASTTLAAGDTQPASMLWQSPGGGQNNIYTQGRVSWTDSIGNAYGPLASSAWYDHLGPPVPLGTISLAGLPNAPVPVDSTQSFTATALDDRGQPAPGVTMTVNVTGANPQVLTAMTDAGGVAHFSYAPVAAGGDTLIASATITTGPTQSTPGTIFWSAAYGTPCTSPDSPLDVVIVIDTSSSMEGAPLEGAKAAARAFLNTMDLSRDQLAIVSFGGVSTLNSPLTSDFAQVSAGLDSVEPGGGFINPTNIGAGLSTALDEITSSRARATATPIIVFVSDGGNSFGDPEPALARLKTSGIRTFAFGLGPDANFAMLQRIASSKNELFYVPTADELVWLYSNLRDDVCRNQVPLAHAGGDQGAYSVRLPHQLTLHGEVHDDGPVGTLTSAWTVVSGPAPVTFLDASSPETVALFVEPGTYVLRLSASDGEFTGTDDATITVDSEPSLAGASLVATLGTPGPLTVGTSESLVTTLTDSAGAPIADFPVQVTITGPDAQTATIVTDASGTATFAYTGVGVGTDVLTALALGTVQLPAAPLSVAWTAPTEEQVVTQGWIGAPTHQSTVKGSVGITVSDGVTLTSGTVTYWPFSEPDQVHTLATGVSGGPGAVIATLDTTVLANGPWVVKLDGTDDQGHSQISETAVTVSGDYKPGRVVVEETDMTIPVVGIPVTVGRRYDSLEKDNVGDFGNGWSLTLGHPRLEVDPAHNVTITMPDNRRVTFYFQATSATASVTFAWLYTPGFVPEAGTFGSLTSDGCDLMVLSAGQLVCFLDNGLEFAPTTYKYTDPYGRVFTMAASGELKSIVDRQQNTLTFTPNGITSNSGVSVAFARDALGRITSITSPQVDALNNHQVINYTYDDAGDLMTVALTDNATETFTYDAHRLLTSKDPNGNAARTSTYDDTGHLLTDTDALGNVTSYAYDFDARTTTITNPDHGTDQQTFDDRGLLLKEVDPLGRTTQHTYDASRNELARTNAIGEVTTMTYDSNGNQTSIKNDRGETTRITYNDVSQPLTSTDPAGHTTTIGYDDMGIPTSFSDELGTLATFTSSEHGLPITVTDAVGNTAYLAYDGAGDLTARTDRLGRTTTSVYDGVGRPTQKTDPRGTGTSYAYLLRGPKSGMTDLAGIFGARSFAYLYDENLNLTSETSDLGRFTNYTYDALNHLTKVTHADNTSVQYTRDFRGNPLTMNDESGRTTTYEYDKAGQLTKTTFPDGTFTTRAYDDLGRLATATDERGNATTYEYETGCGCAERVTKVTDPLGRATVTTYDAVGRRASVTDAAGHTTAYGYDVRGHLTTTTYADGTTEVDAYDALGRRTSHTDQMGSVTQYGYDAEGQLTSVTDALSHVTQYGYDASGNLTSMTDANGHTTTYVYDHLNRKSQRTLPLGMSETWAYNMYGDNTSHTDFRGKTTTMTYDGLARMLTKVPDPNLGEPTVTFAYNPTGTRATMADASGSTAYGYDTRDRLLTKATPAGALTYTYDPAGNVATIRSSNANGTSVDYVWDAANQLVSVTDNRAGGMTTAAYTATGRPSTLTQPSGVGATYSYDSRDRVTSLAWARGASAAFGSWSYAFNGRGQRTSATDAAGRHVAYGYDAVSRLVSETITNDPQGSLGNGELSYSLDPTGNRLSRTSTLAALGEQSFAYDANDELTTDGYDANGNTTSSDGHAYAYDFENRLLSKDSGAVTIGYDGDGNRVAKTVGGVTTKYLVDDLNPTGYLQVLEEVSAGAVQVEYTYGTMLVSETRQSESTSQTSYYGFDAHRNITFLTNAAGEVTDTYDYDASGILVAATGVTPNNRLYDAEEFDRDLGLINLRARTYNPNTGRFLTLDPAPGQELEPLSLNRYLYGKADAVNRYDALGLEAPGYAATLGFAFALEAATTIELGVGGAAVTVTTEQALAVGLAVACALSVQISAFDANYVPPFPLSACKIEHICRRKSGPTEVFDDNGNFKYFQCIYDCHEFGEKTFNTLTGDCPPTKAF